MTILSKCYTIKETSVILGIKVRTVRDWLSRGNIKGYKSPQTKRWFISAEEIERIMDNGYKNRKHTE